MASQILTPEDIARIQAMGAQAAPTPEPESERRGFVRSLITPIPAVERAAARASERLTEPTLERGVGEARVRGFLGGALEGAASLATPLDIVTLIGIPGARPVIRALKRSLSLRGETQATKVLSQVEQRQADIAKLQQEATRVKSAGARAEARAKVTSAQGELRKDMAEARRVLAQPRLEARALTRAGKPVPKELQERIGEAGREMERLRSPLTESLAKVKAGARKQARQVAERPVEMDRAEAAAVGVLRKMGAPEEAIAHVRAALAKPVKKATTRKQKKAWDEAGQSMAELLMHLGVAGVGAAGGAAAGVAARPEDSERSPLAFGVAGAGLGALTGLNATTILNAMAQAPRGAKIAAGARRGLDLNFAMLLSGPATLAKSMLGSMGGGVVKAIEFMALGEPAKAAHILRRLSPDKFIPVFTDAFMNPTKWIPKQVMQKMKVPVREGMLGYPTRIIAAGDAILWNAVRGVGVTREEALRLALSGDPRTPVGQAIMLGLGQNVPRLITKGRRAGKMETIKNPFTEGELAQLTARFFFPFPRVAAQLVENAMEFSPLQAIPGIRRALGTAEAAKKLGVSTARLAATRGAMGPLVGGGLGVLQARETAPDIDALVTAMGGPLALWTSLGQQIQRRAVADSPPEAALHQVFAEASPFTGEMFSLADIPGRVVPGLTRDIAKGMDPAFGRSTGGTEIREALRQERGTPPGMMEGLARTMFGKAISRFPILRETLPERMMPVDVFGRPRFPDRPDFIPDITLRGFGRGVGQEKIIDTTLPKMMTATPLINPPAFPTGDPTAQMVRGVQRQVGRDILSPPQILPPEQLSEIAEITGQGVERIPRDIRAAALRARGAPLEAVLSRLRDNEQFERMPPNIQALLLRRIIGSTRAATGPAVTGLTTAAMLAPERQEEIRGGLRKMIEGFERRIR